jgi:hypothetical protein
MPEAEQSDSFAHFSAAAACLFGSRDWPVRRPCPRLTSPMPLSRRDRR